MNDGAVNDDTRKSAGGDSGTAALAPTGKGGRGMFPFLRIMTTFPPSPLPCFAP